MAVSVCYNIYLYSSVHHTSVSVSSLEPGWLEAESNQQAADEGGGREVLGVTNVMLLEHDNTFIFIQTSIQHGLYFGAICYC